MEAAGRGRGGEKRKPFLPSPPPSRTFLRSPQFSRVQEAKNASNLRTAPRKRLLRRLHSNQGPQPCLTFRLYHLHLKSNYICQWKLTFSFHVHTSP